MVKRKKIKIIVAVLIVLLVGFSIWHNSQKDWIILKSDKKAILHFEEGISQGNTCTVLDSSSDSRLLGILESEYIYFAQCKYKANGNYGHYGYATETDCAKLKIYNLSTRKKIGEIDLTEVIREYLKRGFEWEQTEWFVYTVNQEIYVELQFEKIDRDASPTLKGLTICINLNTKEVEEHDFRWDFANSIDASAIKKPEILVEKERAYNYSVEIIGDIGLLKANGFTEEEIKTFLARANDEASIRICLRRSMLPEENKQLYTEFPGLKEYKGKDEDLVYICLSDYLTAEEILSMFLEEGQEISFEGCVLPAESSIDGQEHEINSFEDYYQWKKWDK